MAAVKYTGEGVGNKGSQTSIEQTNYGTKVESNKNKNKPIYSPTIKHEPGRWGTPNPIPNREIGQKLLDSGYKNGKQFFNIMDDGTIVKFQPDNSGGYHAYEVSKPRDIPGDVLKKFLNDGKITKTEYNKLIKGKR